MNKIYYRQLKVVYIEVTNKCNINCKYCYETQKKLNKQVFTKELFAHIIDNVARYSCYDEISIIFHGGEPLLVSTDFYEYCFAYATTTLETVGKSASFGLQSNLMLLQNDLIPLLLKYSVGVSTSIDGPQSIHDEARSGWKMTIENMKKLRDAGVKVNFITVCSQHNQHHIADIFNFARDFNYKTCQISIASCVKSINPESTYSPLTEDEIFAIYKAILNCWMNTGIHEKNMEVMLQRYLNPDIDFIHTHQCESPFCYAGYHMLVFTPDKKIHLCSPAVPLASQYPEFIAGSVDDIDSSQQLLHAMSVFHQKDEKYMQVCPECEAACICSFGCPAFDRIDPVTASEKCKATKRFYEYLKTLNKQELIDIISMPYESNSNR